MRIRTPLVIHETVDDEVVMINLETGNYYSLLGTGARIWGVLEREATAQEITAQMHAERDPGVRDAVESFLADLEQEGLIVPTGAEATDRARSPEGGVPLPTPRDEVFEPPILRKFTDMQELILLDPVHEVEEDGGWPHERSAR